jgi:thymidine phosphorylase
VPPAPSPRRGGVTWAPFSFPQHVIARKRDGGELDRAEIEAFVRGATDGSWADYQLSALLMAIFLKGMTPGRRPIR